MAYGDVLAMQEGVGLGGLRDDVESARGIADRQVGIIPPAPEPETDRGVTLTAGKLLAFIIAECDDRILHTARSGLSATTLHHFRDFLGNLDDLIKGDG